MMSKSFYSNLSEAEKLEYTSIPKAEKKQIASHPPQEKIDWGVKMFLPEAWHLTRGAGVKVAVLDTGVDAGHEDLALNIVAAKDFTNSNEGFYDTDKLGHGTHVAGIIGAIDNEIGVVGIAPEVDLYCGKVLRSSAYGQISWLVDGITWAIENEVDVISMSLGTLTDDEKLHSAIKEARCNGIYVICAAGNRGSSLDAVDYPAKYDETLAVGSIDLNKKISSFSSVGKQVDVVAPGQDIWSTIPGSNYGLISGTSMATPFVSGLIALMISKHRIYGGHTELRTLEDLKSHLKKVTEDLGPLGRDYTFGHGLVDPCKLLAL